MKRYILFFIWIISFVLISCKKDEPAPVASVEVKDMAIVASYTEADVQWSITSSASISEVIIEYSADSTFSKFEEQKMAKSESKYNASLKSLAEQTVYYARCRVVNKFSSYYSSKVISFKTKGYHTPKVSTDSITAITVSSAKLHAQLLDWGTDTLPQVGFCVAKHKDVTISDDCHICSLKDKQEDSIVYSISLSQLQDNVTYYVRAYARNHKGIAYGDEMSFQTVKIVPPSVGETATSNITYTSASCKSTVLNDGGSSVTERGVCYSTSKNPTTSSTKVISESGVGSFSCVLQNLKAGTTYYVRAYATNKSGTGYGKETSFATTAYGQPTVTTSSVSNITYTTATCGGNVTADGGQSVTARGVCYSTYSNPTISNSKVASGSGTGSFSCTLTGLTAGKTYYVRAYATNSKGTAYGNEFTFTTTAYQAPTVTTQTPSNISYTTATCGGNVTADGGQTVTTRGICYATSQNPTTSNSKVTSGSGTGTFSCNLTNLTAGTTYYVRAYAINNAGTSYGNQVVLSTTSPSAPTVTTGTSFTCTSSTTMTCSGSVVADNGASITERGICWSITSNPTITGNHATASSGLGDFSASLTNLTMGTSYHVRAYAKNSAGVGYGDDVVCKMPSEPTYRTTSASRWGTSGSYYIAAEFALDIDEGLEVISAGYYYSTKINGTSYGPVICTMNHHQGTYYSFEGTYSGYNEYSYIHPYVKTNIGIFYGSWTYAYISHSY